MSTPEQYPESDSEVLHVNGQTLNNMFTVAGKLIIMKTYVDDVLSHFYAQGTIPVSDQPCFVSAWFIPGQINTPSTEIYLALQATPHQPPCYYRFLRAVPLTQFHFERVAELLRTHIPKQLRNVQKNKIQDELGAALFDTFKENFIAHSMMLMRRLACTDQSLAIENRHPSVEKLESMGKVLERIEEKSGHIEQHLIAPKTHKRTRTAADNRAICMLYEKAARDASPERYSHAQCFQEHQEELNRYHATSAKAVENAVRAHRAAKRRQNKGAVAARRPAPRKAPFLTREEQLHQRLP